jgi:hypothetical protein
MLRGNAAREHPLRLSSILQIVISTSAKARRNWSTNIAVEFDHYNISNKRANLDIGSVAIAQQLRSASQAFLSTKKRSCKRIPIETLEGTSRS